MNHTSFQSWRWSAQSAALWVYGKPGHGKSHLAARVIKDLGTSEPGTDAPAVAYAYCTTTQTKTAMTTSKLLGSILRQLCKKLPLSENIESLLSRAETGRKEEMQRTELKDGIRTVISRLRCSYIIIDGLDECNSLPDRQFEGICQFLASLAKPQESTGLAKVLIFSRPQYTEIDEAFFNKPKILVDSHANNADVSEFISIEVKRINNDPSPEERSDLEEVKRLMLGNAGGNFLWVYFKMKSIKDIGCVEDIKNSLQDTTEDLDELYGKELRKILEHGNLNVRERALKALLWVTNSVRSLSKTELYEALAVKPGRIGLNRSQRLLPNVSLSTECADLISEVNGFYQLRHASLKDFLWSELPSLLEYGTLQRQAHTALAETCLRYLNFHFFGSIHLSSSEELLQLKFQYPLLEYAAMYWGHHFSEGRGIQRKLLGDLLAELLNSQASMRVSLQANGSLATISLQTGESTGPTPLHLLSVFNLFDVADSMPNITSYLEGKDDLGRTPIEYSILYRRREMARWLLDHYLEQHRNGTSFDQGILRAGLLHKAVGYDWIEIVNGLLEMGFDKNEGNVEDKTPLHVAAEKSANEVMRRLLDLDVPINVKDWNHETPLILAAVNENGPGVKTLLQSGANVHADNARAQALHYAALRGCVSMIIDLLDHGADPNARSTAVFQEATPLHFAAQANMRDAVDILIQRGARPETVNNLGQSALHDAAARGHLEVLYLLKDQCKADTSDATGYTPLHHAALYDFGGFIKEMIHMYPGLNINPHSNDGFAPIHFAAINGASSAVKALIDIDSTAIVAKDQDSRLPLHLASSFGHLHCATMLLSPDTINARDKFGVTPLKVACRSGYMDLVQYLVLQGANVNELDNDGMTPVATALENEHLTIVTFLLNRGADLRIFPSNGTNIFHLAAEYGDKKTLEKLAKLAFGTKPNVDESMHLAAIDTAGQDVMIYASFAGRPENAAALHELGLPLDGFGGSLSTPLCVAAEFGRPEFIKTLVSLGASLEERESIRYSRLRQTSLHFALKYRNLESAAVLLTHGADPTLKDIYGICGFDYIARDPTLSAAFGYLVKFHVPVDSSSLKRSYARVAMDLSRSILEARTVETKKRDASNGWQETELYEVLKRLQVVSGNRGHNFQLYGVDFTNHHPSGRYCDVCRNDVTAPWFSCTSCVDLDLCPTCHDGYLTSEPPQTIRKSVTALWSLEDDVYPVLRATETFRKRGANFLPICFRLLGTHALAWIHSKPAKCWEDIVSKDGLKWDLRKIPGWRFIRLLEKLRDLDWPDVTEGDILEAGQAGTIPNIHDELVEIYRKFSPWQEHPRPACNGHAFVEIVPLEQLPTDDQDRFDAQGHLGPEFFHELIREYEDHGLPPLDDEYEATKPSTWNPSGFIEKQKVAASSDERKCPEQLKSIRIKLLEAASASSAKKKEFGRVQKQGVPAAGDPEIDVFEVAWKLAHAMLGVDYTTPLVQEG